MKSKLIGYAKNIYIFCRRHVSKSTVLLFLLALVLLAGFSKSYYLGGDDTRLFYIYPIEYLNNFTLNLATNVGLSSLDNFMPSGLFNPFLCILILLRVVFGKINLQSLLYSINILVGFLTFYKLYFYVLRINKKNVFTIIIGLLSSFMYVYSIFNSYVLYSSKLISIFIISLIPLGLLLIAKSITEKKLYLMFVCALIWTIFGITSISIPWVMAAIISLLPLLVYISLTQKKRSVKYFGVLLIAIVFLNVYWLWDVPNYLNTGKSNTTAIDLNSKEFAYNNSIGIIDTASHNSLFYPLFNLFHKDIQINYNWPYLKIFNSWYLKLSYFNWIFFAAVIIAGFLVNKHKNLKGVYYASLISFVLSIYFYTVNFGDLSFGNPGVEIFVWLNNNVPGFMMFRNMYDKFAYAMSFTYAFVFGVSLQIIIENLRNKRLKIYLIGIVTVVVFLNIKPALLGEFKKLPIWTTNNTFNSVESLDSSYLSLVNYVGKMNDYSKFLTLPLAGGNVTAIKDDKSENHYYVGVSPFLILSGKNDFSGLMSFGNYQNEVDSALRSKNYEKLGRLFQIFNIRYVNLNKTISEELKNSYIYGDKIYYEQGDEFYKEILGKKIKDFGDNYSLYRINEKYDSAKIIGVPEVGKYLDYYKEFSYSRISDSQFEFDVTKDSGVNELIFLEPYHKKWSLYIDGVKLDDNSHQVAYGYANFWDISLLSAGGHRAKIYYEPKKYQNAANIFSLLCGLGATTYCLIRLSKDRKKA